jgi:hypothetical protein
MWLALEWSADDLESRTSSWETKLLTAQPAVVDALRAYRHAIPFSEAERHWLLDQYRQLVDRGVEDVEAFRELQGEVLDAAQLKVVLGSELLRRWSEWRCGRDELRPIETVRTAVSSLEELSGLLADS